MHLPHYELIDQLCCWKKQKHQKGKKKRISFVTNLGKAKTRKIGRNIFCLDSVFGHFLRQCWDFACQIEFWKKSNRFFQPIVIKTVVLSHYWVASGLRNFWIHVELKCWDSISQTSILTRLSRSQSGDMGSFYGSHFAIHWSGCSDFASSHSPLTHSLTHSLSHFLWTKGE